MSKGKKIFAIIFGIILVLFLAVVGMGAKLYWDVSKSMDKTYETVERSKKSQVNLNNKEPFSVLLLGSIQAMMGVSSKVVRIQQLLQQLILVTSKQP